MRELQGEAALADGAREDTEDDGEDVDRGLE